MAFKIRKGVVAINGTAFDVAIGVPYLRGLGASVNGQLVTVVAPTGTPARRTWSVHRGPGLGYDHGLTWDQAAATAVRMHLEKRAA